MKLARRLVPLLVMGLLLATMACVGEQDAPEANDGGTPHPATAQDEGHQDPGFSDDHVLFGQSAAFTGPAQELGKAMRLGIERGIPRGQSGRRRPWPRTQTQGVG